jgi:hypothetical protein
VSKEFAGIVQNGLKLDELLAAPGGGDAGYLDGLVPKAHPGAGSAGVSVAAGTSNAFGAWVEIIPVNTVTVAFVIVGFAVNVAAGASLQIEVGRGASGAEVTVGHTAFGRVSDAGYIPPFFLPKPVKVAANSRVAARTASVGAATFGGVRVLYYPLA